MAEKVDGEDSAVKVSRSISVCDTLPQGHPMAEGHCPAVLVMFHPSMKEMAARLVQETTTRITKLKLSSSGVSER